MPIGYPGGLSPHDPLSSQGAVEIAAASVLHSGQGVPNAALGQNGDYYLRQDAAGCDTSVYVKIAGVWTACGAAGGGGGSEGTGGTLTRDTSGLVFKDEFDRPNSGTVNNGWSETAGLTQITGNRLQLGNSTNREAVWQAIAFPTDYILETRALNGSNFSNDLFGQSDGNPTTFDGIETAHDPGTNQVWVRRWDAGVITYTQATALVHAITDRIKCRLVAERSLGALTEYRGYWVTDTGALPAFPSIGGDPTLTVTRVDGVAKAQNNILISGRDGFFDYVFLCRRLITVSGLPTGWQARLIPDGTATVLTPHGPFAESGGVATINVDAKALPFHTIQVLDAASVVQASLTPGAAPDIYGGDVYTFTPA